MSAFPVELPTMLDVPEVIQMHDWQAFRRLTYMHNHWDRPGWTVGRRSYHWMLSFDHADNVRQMAEQCQIQLPRSVMDLVPLDALHVTLGRIAFTDEISLFTALEVADQARFMCDRLAPFQLTIGPLAGSRGAIRFSVAPWSPLLKLHQQLTAATRKILDARCIMDTTQFRPHLSIAYANVALPLIMLYPVLERLRALSTEDMIVSTVHLVELRRERRAYQYEQLRILQLGE